MTDQAPIAAAEGLSKERLRTWLKILKATRRIEGELRERMRREAGTTLPRFDAMAALHRSEAGLTMSELSAALRVSNGNVTGLVDRLAGEGLARREAVEGDRRASRVRLTPEGRARFAALARRHEAWVDELLAPIGAEGLRVIQTRLARVADPASPGAAPPSPGPSGATPPGPAPRGPEP